MKLKVAIEIDHDEKEKAFWKAWLWWLIGVEDEEMEFMIDLMDTWYLVMVQMHCKQAYW